MSNKLFQELDLHNKPKRNGYNLGHRVNFTAKCGELLPIAHYDVIIGDKFRLDLNSFSRTAPADTAAATKIREYYDVFFVPYRLLWKNAPAVHTQNTKNPVSATSPNSNLPVGTTTPQFDISDYIPISGPNPNQQGILRLLIGKENMFGYNRGYMSAKLMNHLGYGYLSIQDIENVSLGTKSVPFFGPKMLSLYPLLAYQCIYYNFFRNSQWEDNQPYNYNVDYLSQSTEVSFPTSSTDSTWATFWDNPTLFDLQYANYPKDLFFGFFPDAQFGDESTVSVNVDNQNGDAFTPVGTVISGQLTNVYAQEVSTQTSEGTRGTATALVNSSGNVQIGALMTDFSKDFVASFGILELRKKQFLQKYKEIRGSGNQTYANLVRKIFGVNIPDTLDTVPLYLGGSSSTISFSEIENTNLANENEATIKGKGIGGNNMRTINFEPKENGCIMVIYHCQPVVDYALNALHFDVVRTEADDFANPIFDQLGFQELPSYFLDLRILGPNSGHGETNSTIGYTTRYFDYKTAVDRTLGDFRETQTTWLSPVNFDYLRDYLNGHKLDVNSNFFKVNPSILDPIFALKASSDSPEGSKVTTDQIRVFCNLNVSAIRPLDKDGTPY